jgi:ketol-acid reductoisomerase
MRILDVGGTQETVLERADFPPDQVRSILGEETIAVLGYGTQGRAQALNLREQRFKVLVGLREGGASYPRAVADGWQPGMDLVSLPEAAARGSVLLYLLSDAGQKEQWGTVRPHLTAGKALVFAHGFSIVYQDQTGIVPPSDVDVLLVAPKGSGTTLRRQFLEGRWMNAGYAVHQDASGRAMQRCVALCFAIGSGFLFPTTFAKETTCDLVGERGTLLGAIFGLWLAQYEVLREHGHSAVEAFNESVEEATQSLYPLIAEKGMDWMYANCSTTAQRGALDWYQRFRDALKPVFTELYHSVASGQEARTALAANSQPDYHAHLQQELAAIAASEMWQAGKLIRALRPPEEKATSNER